MTRNKITVRFVWFLISSPLLLSLLFNSGTSNAYVYRDDSRYEVSSHDEENEIDNREPTYRYEYQVNSPHTGDYKTQHEERIGDTVRGSYSLMEPDGTMRIVEYTADALHGFKAVVKREPAASLGAHSHSHSHSHPYPQPHSNSHQPPARPLIQPTPSTHVRVVPTKIPEPIAKYPKKLFYTVPHQPYYYQTPKPYRKYLPLFRFHGWPPSSSSSSSSPLSFQKHSYRRRR